MGSKSEKEEDVARIHGLQINLFTWPNFHPWTAIFYSKSAASPQVSLDTEKTSSYPGAKTKVSNALKWNLHSEGRPLLPHGSWRGQNELLF